MPKFATFSVKLGNRISSVTLILATVVLCWSTVSAFEPTTFFAYTLRCDEERKFNLGDVFETIKARCTPGLEALVGGQIGPDGDNFRNVMAVLAMTQSIRKTWDEQETTWYDFRRHGRFGMEEKFRLYGLPVGGSEAREEREEEVLRIEADMWNSEKFEHR